MPTEVHRRVQIAGLSTLMVDSFTMIDRALMSAMAERWHPETSSFHMPFGEMIITIDDVNCLLHLSVRGSFFILPVMDVDIAISYLQLLLGCSQAEATAEVVHMRGAHVRLAWLEDVYDAWVAAGQWDYAARAFILLLLGSTLVADKSQVYVDVKYPELVRDL